MGFLTSGDFEMQLMLHMEEDPDLMGQNPRVFTSRVQVGLKHFGRWPAARELLFFLSVALRVRVHGGDQGRKCACQPSK